MMELHPDPFEQFRAWLARAQQAGGPDPHAFTLATVDSQGLPQARMLILRGFDERGFVFYTDADSPKARELAGNARAALVFWWPASERQVRVLGAVSVVAREQTEEYWRGRPRGAQVAAWVRQSQPVADRAALDGDYRQLEARFDGAEVPLPPFWSGYRVEPDCFEFWQGQRDRLHDRARYTRSGDEWRLELLTP